MWTEFDRELYLKDLRSELISELRYDAETGNFYRKKSISAKKKKGDVVGKVGGHRGYVQVYFNGMSFSGHRLAWFYVHGYFPGDDMEIDHINRIKNDNRLKNLRVVTKAENRRNSGNYLTNTSGVRGVCKRGKKWRAYICPKGILKSLGFYKSFDNAVCARLAAEQCFNWIECNNKSPAEIYFEKNIKPDFSTNHLL